MSLDILSGGAGIVSLFWLPLGKLCVCVCVCVCVWAYPLCISQAWGSVGSNRRPVKFHSCQQGFRTKASFVGQCPNLFCFPILSMGLASFVFAIKRARPEKSAIDILRLCRGEQYDERCSLRHEGCPHTPLEHGRSFMAVLLACFWRG